MYRLQTCSIDAFVFLLLVHMLSVAQRGAADAQRALLGKVPRCCLCGTQFRGKQTLPHGTGRKCKPRCRSSPAVPPPPPVLAAPATIAPPPAPSAPALPPGQLTPLKQALPPLLLHDKPTMTSHCWSLTRKMRRSSLLALKWKELIDSGELRHWEEKRCKFWQLDTRIQLECSHMDQLRVSLRHGTEAFFRQTLRDHSIDADPLRLVDIKLLRCAQGEGLQEIHCDIPDPAVAALSYTCLLYLVDTLSTAVPIAPHSADRHAACYQADAASVRHGLLRRIEFCSCAVFAGDHMLLRCDCPHFGVANPYVALRYVLFACFAPKKLPLPDTEDQRYPQGVKD